MADRRGILAIGNLLVDQSLRCEGYPQESMLTLIEGISQSCGGGCTNVLFNLATIDAQLPLWLCGVTGDDDWGRFILQEATRHGVNCEKVRILPQSSTAFSYVMVNRQSGQRTFFHHMGANHMLDETDFAGLSCPAKIAHVAYLLLLPALEKSCPQWGTRGAKALAQLKQQGFKVSLDLVSDPEPLRYQQWVAPALPWVDYLIINDEEASRLSGLAMGNYVQQAQILLEKGVQSLVCIHYPAGAVAVSRSGETCRVQASQVLPSQIVSTLGAGDAFCAGLLYAIHQEWPLNQALHLACASARFNLFSASATAGACSIERLSEFLESSKITQ